MSDVVPVPAIPSSPWYLENAITKERISLNTGLNTVSALFTYAKEILTFCIL